VLKWQYTCMVGWMDGWVDGFVDGKREREMCLLRILKYFSCYKYVEIRKECFFKLKNPKQYTNRQYNFFFHSYKRH